MHLTYRIRNNPHFHIVHETILLQARELKQTDFPSSSSRHDLKEECHLRMARTVTNSCTGRLFSTLPFSIDYIFTKQISLILASCIQADFISLRSNWESPPSLRNFSTINPKLVALARSISSSSILQSLSLTDIRMTQLTLGLSPHYSRTDDHHDGAQIVTAGSNLRCR